MIQINLLPDIKAQYVKAERTKHTVVSISVITIIATLGIVGMLAGVAYGAQKIQLSNVQKDITANSDKLKNIEDLREILTIQNQLGVLNGLHDDKAVTTRLLPFVQQITPSTVRASDISLDSATKVWIVSGVAPTLQDVNTYVDTLKFTTIQQTKEEIEQELDPVKAFTNVVLTDFSKDDEGFTYTISFMFDDLLFTSSRNTKLVVPKQTTTRSQTQLPKSDVFTPNPNKENQ